MAKPEHVELVRQGTESLLKWQQQNLGLQLDLEGAQLNEAKLFRADLRGAYLGKADLRGASLFYADLRWANLRGAQLGKARLDDADLSRAYLYGADLSGALSSAKIDFPPWPFFSRCLQESTWEPLRYPDSGPPVLDR